MLNLKDLKKIIQELDMPKDLKEEYIKLFTPFYDMNTFIAKKLDISEEAANELFSLHFNDKLIEKKLIQAYEAMPMSDLIDERAVLEETVKVAGDYFEKSIVSFADKYNYDKTQDILEVLPVLFGLIKEELAVRIPQEKKKDRSNLN
jgi:hypothetical protein